ncbi:MAG: hypothetical protein AB9873_08550 [Syntrophobacteraceae bacterium]
MGAISSKIRKKLVLAPRGRRLSLDDFSELIQFCEKAAKPSRMSGFFRRVDPVHALYASGQHMASMFSEAISDAPEMKEYYKAMDEAERLYMPSGPPISPLTASFFTFWGFFDLSFGKDRETIGTCFIDLADLLGIRPHQIELMYILQTSRMGIYEHCGSKRKFLMLKELLTGTTCQCICEAGYLGRKGELWYARVLPPPVDSVDYSVVMTTPYVLVGHSTGEWIDFFARQGIRESDPQLDIQLGHFMKYGRSRNYWNEFVFQAYFNHRRELIILEGIPDKPETLPHSDVNE